MISNEASLLMITASMAVLGALFRRGLLAKRRGDNLYCRKCGNDLTGRARYAVMSTPRPRADRQRRDP